MIPYFVVRHSKFPTTLCGLYDQLLNDGSVPYVFEHPVQLTAAIKSSANGIVAADQPDLQLIDNVNSMQSFIQFSVLFYSKCTALNTNCLCVFCLGKCNFELCDESNCVTVIRSVIRQCNHKGNNFDGAVIYPLNLFVLKVLDEYKLLHSSICSRSK